MNKMLLSLCRGNKKYMFQVFTIKEKESYIEKKQQKEKKLKYIDCACFNEYWCCEILRGPGQYIPDKKDSKQTSWFTFPMYK